MQFKYFTALLLATIGFTGCFWKEPGTWKNDQINSSAREDFHKQDDQLLKYLKADDIDQIKTIESRELLESNAEVGVDDKASNLLKSSDYKLYDEYYVVNKYKDADTILNKGKSINTYNLTYNNTAREMYIAFFLPKNNLENKWIINAIFSKLSYGWKLTSLDFGLYTVNGKTAPELYELIKQEYKNNNLLNAGLHAQEMHTLANPVFIWKYTQDDSMYMASYRIGFAAKKLVDSQMVLKDVPTHPRIFKIIAGEFNDGYYPKFYYQTSINVSDTNAIRKENNEIMKVLPSLYPGVNKGNGWLLFSAFNKLPNVKVSVPRYEMENKVN